jgi:hypothetical protein
MSHDPSVTVAGEWGEATCTCSCGTWSVTRDHNYLALAAHAHHRAYPNGLTKLSPESMERGEQTWRARVMGGMGRAVV